MLQIGKSATPRDFALCVVGFPISQNGPVTLDSSHRRAFPGSTRWAKRLNRSRGAVLRGPLGQPLHSEWKPRVLKSRASTTSLKTTDHLHHLASHQPIASALEPLRRQAIYRGTVTKTRIPVSFRVISARVVWLSSRLDQAELDRDVVAHGPGIGTDLIRLLDQRLCHPRGHARQRDVEDDLETKATLRAQS